MPRFILIVLALWACDVLAKPPVMACWSGQSVEEAFEQHQYDPLKNTILIVGTGGFDDEDWLRSIWNDGEFAAYLKEHSIQVAYMDQESDPVLHEILDISVIPTIVFYHDHQFLTRRRGLVPATPEQRLAFIQWVDAARVGQTLAQQISKKLEDDPENIELRFELIKEYNNEINDVSVLEQVDWLLDYNEIWYKSYVNSEEFLSSETTSDSETQFRSMILSMVGGSRDQLKLYKQSFPDSEQESTTDGWAAAIHKVHTGWVRTKLVRMIEVLVKLRRTLETRRDNGTATERDLFILHVLTAEGEEWNSLVEQY